MVSNYNPKFYRREVTGGIPDTAKYAGVRKVKDKYVKTIDGADYEIIFDEDATDVLADWWEKADAPGAYSGRDKFYDGVKAKYVGVSRRTVQQFLNNLETAQVHTAAKTVKVNRPFLPQKPLQTWSCDLVSITNSQDEPLFTLFTCIDDFSKFAWAVIVPDKTAKACGNALETIFIGESPRIPQSVRSDNGGEFAGKRPGEFDRLLSDWNVRHIRTDSYNPQQNSIVERFNKSIKSLINKWLTHSNGVMIDPESLQGLVKNYNTSTHGTTKLAPIDLHPTEEKAVSAALVDAVEMQYELRAENLLDRNDTNYPPIAAGDFVRVHKSANSQWRKKTKLKKYGYQRQFDYEIYRVLSVSEDRPGLSPQYTLADEDGSRIPKKFIRSQLLKIDPDKLMKELEDGVFVADKILDSKLVGRGKNRHTEYKVAYRGWPEDTATWERAQDSYQKLIDEYEAQ